MEKRRWTGSELARNAGLTPSTVLRLLNDPDHRFVPSLKTLQKISAASGQPIPKKVFDAIGVARSDASQQRGFADQEVGRLRDAGRTVRLRPISSLPTGLQAERGEVLVRCPPQLDGDETAFACYTPDAALEPWVKSGSLLFGTNRRDPIKDDLVLLTDAQGRSKVRLLVHHDGRAMTVKAGSGALETVSLDDLKDVAVIAVIVRS
jgi:transcriptional regulator with XRE-family HTH domain